MFVHSRAQPTTGAPATAASPAAIRLSPRVGMTPALRMNQASVRTAASGPELKASWFTSLHLWASEQNPNESQHRLCGSAPRHFPEPVLPRLLPSPSSPKPRLRWRKKGASAILPPANHAGLLRLTSSDRARGRWDTRPQPGLGDYSLKAA